MTASAPPPYGGFDHQPIAGIWRHGKGTTLLADHDPYTGELLVEIPQADGSDVADAYAGAQRAAPAWAATLPSVRADLFRRAARILEARSAETISWLVRESGSVRQKAAVELLTTREILLEASALAHLAHGRMPSCNVPGKESRVLRKPVGVVGVISPWNWPLHLGARSLAPALALGNAVVVKPASDTPVTGGLLLARILEEAGLPHGVLSVVVGSGSALGDAFVCHRAPRVITFTGSTPVGRHIARLAAEAPILKRVELELGGNAPFVVLADADLELAVEAAVFGKFLHQGQICMSVNRLIVDDSVHDEFRDRFVSRVRTLGVGDPDLPDTVVGPVINAAAKDRLVQRIAETRASDARQLLGGEVRGQVVPPHVFDEVTNDMSAAREEWFGPVAPLLRARGDEDALRIANDTEYGLAGAVFTRDLDRGARFASRLEVGMAHVCDQPVNDSPFNPFGGEKNSGIGRFNGEWAIEAFTTVQWLSVQREPRPYFRKPRAHG